MDYQAGILFQRLRQFTYQAKKVNKSMTSDEEEIFSDEESPVQGLSGSKEESDDDAPPNIKTLNLFSKSNKGVTSCKKRIIENENETTDPPGGHFIGK